MYNVYAVVEASKTNPVLNVFLFTNVAKAYQFMENKRADTGHNFTCHETHVSYADGMTVKNAQS
jgi:hypothetical protein